MGETSLLVVDDNSVALKELTDALKYLGCRDVQSVTSANEAWAMLRVKGYSGVFSAWDMPEMTGLALLRVVRSDEKHTNLPFFLSDSAFTKPKVLEAGMAGVSGLLVKPFSLDSVKDKLAIMAEINGEHPPSPEEVSFDKGMGFLESGEQEKALEVFQDILAEGESAETYYNIGYIKTAQGQYQEGIKAFRKATQLDRFFAKAYEAMGRAYRELGETEKAEECLQEAAQIYMTSEKDEYAEQILNEILELHPDTVNVYNSLGVLYRRRGDSATALAHYEKALKIHPNTPHIYYNIGRVHVDMKNLDRATKYFRQALKLDPGFTEAKEALDAVELGQL